MAHLLAGNDHGFHDYHFDPVYLCERPHNSELLRSDNAFTIQGR